MSQESVEAAPAKAPQTSVGEAAQASQEELPFVIMELADCKYGLSSGHVREMLVLPAVTPMQKVAAYVRGVINLRGKVVPLVDMRVRLGLPTFSSESRATVELLREREKDHVRWIEELENSVKEDREFKGEVDPTRCAFGRWYAEFSTNNQLLAMQLRKFDGPHRAVHGLARRVAGLRTEGNAGEALNIIRATHDTELAELRNLFETTCRLIEETSREIALVLEREGRLFAISVDAVATVERIRPETIEEPPPLPSGAGQESPVVKLARRVKDDEVVSIIDPAKIMPGCDEAVLAEAPAAETD